MTKGLATEEKVTARYKEYLLMPGTYWHLTSPDDNLLHNAFVGEGITMAVSSVRKFAGLEKATSPYAYHRADKDPKEAAWEKIRQESFKELPSRNGAIYLFDDKDTANGANNSWFAKAKRELVEVRIVKGASVHTGDTELLNCQDRPSEWEAFAKRYWSGEMTEKAIREVLVHGELYFPGWKEKPFGLWKPRSER